MDWVRLVHGSEVLQCLFFRALVDNDPVVKLERVALLVPFLVCRIRSLLLG